MLRFLLLLAPLLAASAADYDLLIRNGRLLDGSGGAAVRADLAVKEGKIVLIQKQIS